MSFYAGSTPFKKPAMITRNRLEFDRFSQFPPPENGKINGDETDCTGSSLSLDSETISVHLRLKPSDYTESCYKIEDNVIIARVSEVINPTNPNKDISEKHFSFNSIMNSAVSQKEVYETTVGPAINEIFTERGATFLSYGTSNSGKTYTILGDKNPGIVLRGIAQIFSMFQSYISEWPLVKIENDNLKFLNDGEVEDEMTVIKMMQKENRTRKIKLNPTTFEEIQAEHNFELKEEDQLDHASIFVWVGFIEIYNEKIIDLLDLEGNTLRRNLKIMSNEGNSYVKGMTFVYVKSMEEAYEVLQFGLKRIKYSATEINDNSSRSHSIFFMNIVSRDNSSNYKWTSYKFCDLAGAERCKKAQTMGDRLKEAGGINSSLLVLGRCLDIVHQNQKSKKHPELVPVRDSKLTFLLQSSLLGNDRFVLIVNLYPSIEFFDENMIVLNFAAIAKQIVVKKSDVRNCTSRYSRYSIFMKATDTASPRRTANSSFYPSVSMNESIDFSRSSSTDSLDDIEFMTEFDLRDKLKRTIKAQNMYRDEVKRLLQLNIDMEKNLKGEMEQKLMESMAKEREYFKVEMDLKVDYYEKKIENIQCFRARQTKRYKEDIQDLEDENEELREELEKQQCSKCEAKISDRRKSL